MQASVVAIATSTALAPTGSTAAAAAAAATTTTTSTTEHFLGPASYQ